MEPREIQQKVDRRGREPNATDPRNGPGVGTLVDAAGAIAYSLAIRLWARGIRRLVG